MAHAARTLAVAVLVLLITSAAASAATVAIADDGSYPRLVLEDAAAQENRIVLDLVPGGLRVTDLAAPLTVGSGCEPAAANEAVCGRNGVPFLVVELGAGDDTLTTPPELAGRAYGGPGSDTITGGLAVDGDDGADTVTMTGSAEAAGGGGDDRLSGSAAGVHLAGGDGADTLTGTAAADGLDGGAGDDVLDGGDGPDRLEGGTGTDIVSGGDGDDEVFDDLEAAPSAYDGGPGRDALSLGAHRRPVRVDLGAPDQLPAAPETASGFEGAAGGAGDDVLLAADGGAELYGGDGADALIGGAGADRLEGGDGRDTLGGRDGDDRLSGGASADVLLGGDGDDALIAGPDSYRDHVDCGAGADRAQLDAEERAAGCERRRRGSVRPFLLIIRTPAGLRLETTCIDTLVTDCSGVATVRIGKGRAKVVRLRCDGNCWVGGVATVKLPALVGRRRVAVLVAARLGPGPGRLLQRFPVRRVRPGHPGFVPARSSSGLDG